MAPKRLPKVYLVRHGETEWTINGRHTGVTDLLLTANGEAIMLKLGSKAVGPGKIIDPNLLSTVLVSPRLRAKRTFELIFSHLSEKPPHIIEEGVREWTYGDYEGFYKHEAAAARKAKGLPSGEGGWDIWVDGCEGGESPEEMTARVDEVIKSIKETHRAWVEHPDRKNGDEGGDVVIISHGHFSRCFLTRWLNLPLTNGRLFVLDPGGVCVMQYYHHDMDKPMLGAMNLGLV
ncbi:hypothetical protein JAAARDRAFT_581190 [Jaapia argillacea MUCL 33604]|uniref:Phosphoglycerate mutase-like protein n=1 Tax=Jaapia argillacea MUCL 33604 TaxID=933084 RepID=A0A067P769_9AGAM|nr:hypothetical protein JAAARDRAFT_581190 [Jaapia argillacea MUCL 33604]